MTVKHFAQVCCWEGLGYTLTSYYDEKSLSGIDNERVAIAAVAAAKALTALEDEMDKALGYPWEEADMQEVEEEEPERDE